MDERVWLARIRDLAERSADPVLLGAAAEEDRRRLALGLDDLVESSRAQAWAVGDVEALAVVVDELEAARRALRGRPPEPPRRRRWRR